MAFRRCLGLVFNNTPDQPLATPSRVGSATEAADLSTGPTAEPGLSDTSAPAYLPTAMSTPMPCASGADKVIAFNPGPGAQPQYGDPQSLLGNPDMVQKPSYKGTLQLGRRGSVLVAFTRSTIMDGNGPDLQVYGESVKDDFVLVEVSDDGQTWYAYPEVAESSGPLDLADVGLARAVFVRLTDIQPATATGAELDAVLALTCGPAVDALPILPDAVARGAVTLYDGPQQTSKLVGTTASNILFTVVGRSSTSEWVQVATTSGMQGWCRATDLAMNVRVSGFPVVQIAPTATPAPPAAGLSDWIVYDGKKVGVRDVSWSRSLGIWVPDTGKIHVSLYIVAKNESDSEYTFSDSDWALADGGGEISGGVIFGGKGPRFVSCTVKPGGTCEGWWTTMIWDRPEVKTKLSLRWAPCWLLCEPMETPILLTAKPAAKPKPPTSAPDLANVGEQIKAGNWSFTITEIQFRKALYFYNSANVAAGVFCVLFIDIQNGASGTAHFGELLWELRDAQGKEYDPDTATVWAAWQFAGKDTPWTDLGPGQTAKIVAAFDVNTGAKGLQFYSYTLKRPFVSIGDAQPPQDQ